MKTFIGDFLTERLTYIQEYSSTIKTLLTKELILSEYDRDLLDLKISNINRELRDITDMIKRRNLANTPSK